jgi:hypothetical protein
MRNIVKTSVSIVDVPGEIQTEHTRSTCRMRYSLGQIGRTVIFSRLISFAT